MKQYQNEERRYPQYHGKGAPEEASEKERVAEEQPHGIWHALRVIAFRQDQDDLRALVRAERLTLECFRNW